MTAVSRPPLLLGAAAVAAGWAAVYSIVVWVILFVSAPVHDDVRHYYVTAETGLRYGWSSIYNQTQLHSLSSSLPGVTPIPDASTPLLAWVFAPFTALPEPIAYALWTVLSVAALIFAWHVAAPYSGIAKFSLLLLALGLGPVLTTLYFGQPTLFLMASVAASWWLCVNERPLAAGAMLALATFLKPQAAILIPAALLVSGRYRVVAGWAAGSGVLGVATLASLGSSGLVDWWHAAQAVRLLRVNTVFTLAQPLGAGPLTYLLWSAQGAVALLAAWRLKRDVEIVFAVGILGTVATASYFHNSDYCVLILAAWLVLRTSPPTWHRLWLLAGVVPMELLLTNFLAGPQLVWDAAWLVILALTSFATTRVPTPAPVPSSG